MLTMAMTFAAASLALVPPVDTQLSQARLIAPREMGRATCGAQFDPQFVRFVPGAASSSHNPLLRLISQPLGAADVATKTFGERESCKTMLTRNAPRP
jgi:hypothetical protein